MEFKTRSGYGGTKRRRFSYAPYGGTSTLNRRIGALQKKVKATNPCHVYPQSLGTGTTNWSTTGAVIDLVSGIVQGDAFNSRFGNKIIPKRVNLKATVIPGSTANSQVTCRLALVRAVANLTAANINASCLSPIADTNILQVYWDKYFTIGPSLTALTGYKNLNITVPIKLGQIKFAGSGAAANVAESLYLIYSSSATTGTTAPTWGNGIVEFFFIP